MRGSIRPSNMDWRTPGHQCRSAQFQHCRSVGIRGCIASPPVCGQAKRTHSSIVGGSTRPHRAQQSSPRNSSRPPSVTVRFDGYARRVSSKPRSLTDAGPTLRGRVGGRPAALSPAKRRLAKTMRAEGTPMAEIAEVLEVARSTLYRHIG
ncbi:helix-turn-helix domain-containing protein [Rhodococcus daqingensis]|uniref:Helix-turn-helix domain-containing protein n=1 Tax=Rhodococcus daqingensis TaxID=2479363 RepID=A0ABW2RUE4_9NOCA